MSEIKRLQEETVRLNMETARLNREAAAARLKREEVALAGMEERVAAAKAMRARAEDDEPLVLPACPECGMPGVVCSIGVMTVVTEGMSPVRARPSPEGARVQCANGHWYTMDGAPSGPPRDFTLHQGPRL